MTRLTLWFTTADADPAAVLRAEPGHDRGFGRKYLAQLDPARTVTHIADIPLNRSAPAGAGEFYVGGYPGLAVVQTVVDGLADPAALPAGLTRGIAADDVYLRLDGGAAGPQGFAHWRGGRLRRSFAATGTRILADAGLPEPVEADYWAGRRRPARPADPAAGVALPFDPGELADAVLTAWLGFDPAAEGPDVPVSAFAVDGRPAPRPATGRARPAGAGPADPAGWAGPGDYDDYEAAPPPPDEARERILAARAAAAGLLRRAGAGARRLGRAAWDRLNRSNEP
ncbi:hypothetical protein CSPHI_09815 [Corynebacterium sphenisci DSM 44792]|uniref:Uncharacterized protein n=1 Tax=Corynebacterium sphenisci DSM 44792 TaxID=1437874 RepID=A0A1L7CZK2_9CORY|nr:hypothetical protein [Corynebacterium sphenisci]APT91252.1 hypothetical protein CSPHI_09815 [Corynebacterium sphenisci DSM 44792]